MRFEQRLGLVVCTAVLLATGACAAASGGPPDRATVSDLIVRTYEPRGNTPTSHVDVALVEIGTGHRATAYEGRNYEVGLGQMIYPVHVKYTLVNGTGPSAMMRDWDTHFFAFRSEQKNGDWDLSSASLRGDINGDLRGG